MMLIEWDAWIDIDDDYIFDSKEKLKMIVQSILNDTVKSTSESEVSFFKLLANVVLSLKKLTNRKRLQINFL